MYSGARDVLIVWLDGTEEKITAYDDPQVVGTVLWIKVDYSRTYRHIPLTSIREWRSIHY